MQIFCTFTYFFNSLFAIESLPSDAVAQNADGGKQVIFY